jgi:hypothetical protein
MIRKLNLTLILLVFLSSCSQAGALELATATIAPTETTAPTPTQELSAVEQLLTAYFSVQSIDVSQLSPAEFTEFSAKLAEKKNAERGINPIIHNNEKYIDPQDLKLKDYDGHPDMNETIEMFVPIAGKDEQGNLQFETNGEIITIPGSTNVDWNMVISDISDTRIEWPKTRLLSSGLTSAESKTAKHGVVLTPMIFLNKDLGEFYLPGTSGNASLTQSTLIFLHIETDRVGHPILARKIITMGLNYYLFKEGSTLDTQSRLGLIPTNGDFYKALTTNAVYYVGIDQEVDETYKIMGKTLENYRGAVTDDSAFTVTLGKEKNDKDMVVIPVFTLIIKKTN